MIDNRISDPTKQIWIDLELYFESYEFSNFLKFFLEFFFDFLMNFLGFFRIKNEFF